MSADAVEAMFRTGRSQRAADHRQTAVVSAVLGIVLLLIAGGVLRATASAGMGTVWGWGFIGGAVFLVRAVVSYVRSVNDGAPHLGPLGWVLGGGGIVLALVVAVTSVQAAFTPAPIAIGDCFTDEGVEVQRVRCSQRHDYTVLDIVSSIGECPAATAVYTRTDDGELACLVGPALGLGG
jgi:hypothetical protein